MGIGMAAFERLAGGFQHSFGWPPEATMQPVRRCKPVPLILKAVGRSGIALTRGKPVADQLRGKAAKWSLRNGAQGAPPSLVQTTAFRDAFEELNPA